MEPTLFITIHINISILPIPVALENNYKKQNENTKYTNYTTQFSTVTLPDNVYYFFM